MPQNKRILFPINDQHTSRYAQALCHPARLQIVKMLRNRVFMIHKEIVQQLPLASGTVSQHLDYLETNMLIEKAVVVGVVVYKLNKTGLQEAKQLLETFLKKVA